MHLCFCAGGSKGLVELGWREGVAEHFGVDRIEVGRTREIKDKVNGKRETEPEDLSVTQ